MSRKREWNWQTSGPVVQPGTNGTFDEMGVKDPSIVFYEGRWHLFYTAMGQGDPRTGYVSARSLEDLKTGERFELPQLRGRTRLYACAPQVFYFEPQETWYLLYQTRDSNLQPAFSTARTIDQPDSWTEPACLVQKVEQEKWIDFWIICDQTTAYLFYTRSHQDVYVMTTSLREFPQGFGEARKVFTDVCEAVHIYKAKGLDEFHMVYEQANEHDIRSFGLAVASHLGGPWERVTDDYATGSRLICEAGQKWTEEVSHGEIIRTGYDQRLEYEPANTRILIQGLLLSEHHGSYRKLPWKLGLLEMVEI